MDHADSNDKLTKVFSNIYKNNVWGNGKNRPTSGGGSSPGATLQYRLYLHALLTNKHIKSVVDVGCGDWAFSRLIDWSGVDYKGFDLVENVIVKDKEQYEAPNIHFAVGNALEELPKADLLIIKDVLQHLSLGDIQKFLDVNVLNGKYKYVLVTGGHSKDRFVPNVDIEPGHVREVSLEIPPFNVTQAKPVLFTEMGCSYCIGKHGGLQTWLMTF